MSDNDMSREDLDKMVDEILAGTDPDNSEEDVPAAPEEPPAGNEQPDEAEADGDAAAEETSDAVSPEDNGKTPSAEAAEEAAGEPYTPANEDDDGISADIGETVAAIQSEKKKKAVKAEKAAKSKKKKAPEQKPLKPIFGIANIVYTAVLFAGLAAAFIFLPRGTVSEIEQRPLAAMPEFDPQEAVNGGFTNGVTEFFNDNVPYRDDLKRLGAQIQNLFGVSFGDAVIMGPVAQITESEEDEEPVVITKPEETTSVTSASTTKPAEKTTSVKETTVSETSPTTPETTAPPETEPVETTKNVNEVAPGVVTNGQVVTKLSDGHWWGISLFGGGKGTRYAACVNKFKELLGDEVNVYSMPIPTAGEYYLPPGYEAYNASHQKSIDSIDSQLVDVISVPASMEMWKHIGETIYLRTDHHWQPLGAYYAAQVFAKYAGVPFADISTMEKIDVPGYVGTMYGFTNDAHILNDPEVFTYYKPSNSYTTYYYDTAYNYTYSLGFFVPMPTGSMYSTFMGADNKIVRIKTDVNNGRKLIVFKDSYGNAEIPFYFGSFEEICVCDIRYFDLNGIEFIKFYGATDVLRWDRTRRGLKRY